VLRSGVALVGAVVLSGTPASAREACQERTLGLRYAPQAGRSLCWAASGQMVMELLGGGKARPCQCRQAQVALGVDGCCAAAGSCVPASELPARCDAPSWPAFVAKPGAYGFEYRTTCDALPGRQDDPACDAKPIGWRALTVEICAGRPVIASFRTPGSVVGHTLVVKGFSTHGGRRVLLVDPAQLCPAGRDCEGELDEAFWVSYDEYAAGWDGRAHWVDFYEIRSRGRGKARSPRGRPGSAPEFDLSRPSVLPEDGGLEDGTPG
jgi:hypothetical protein